MKHKAKRFKEGGGYGRFTEDKLDVEEKKRGLFAGKASDEPEVRSYSETGPEPEPEKKKAKAKPKTKTGSGASGFPLKEDAPINISSGASGFGLKEKEKDPDAYKKTPEGTPGKDSEKKYGIGPHGAFGGIEKAIREYKTPADRRYEEKAPKKMASGGKVSSASSRGDGIAQRGKTRGRMC